MFQALYHFLLKMGATQNTAAASNDVVYAATDTRPHQSVAIGRRQQLGTAEGRRQHLSVTVGTRS